MAFTAYADVPFASLLYVAEYSRRGGELAAQMMYTLACRLTGERKGFNRGAFKMEGYPMNRSRAAIIVGMCILVVTGCAMSPIPPPLERPQAPETVKPPTPPAVDPVEAIVTKPEEPGYRKMNAEPVAAPPPAPFVADGEMEVTASVTFEEPNAAMLCTTDSGEGLGLKWSIVDGAGCYSGTTIPAAPGTWLSNTLQFPVGIDFRTKLEVSGEFRVAECDGFHVIGMRAPAILNASRFCMYYSGRPGQGRYAIQTRWMKMKTTTEGRGSIPAFGDEKDTFHKMRMLLDRSKKEISYYVDDVPLGTVHYEGEIQPVVSMGMDIETPNGGTKMDIRYDNLQVRSFGPLQE